ncbi:hypothetical protein HHI36_001397 [Cryptolaemus montrouzieri]|uniref:Uncharacterized protein n=1 Tax=Cryptolaemus montrouzieri TaxID=559131 RepID=A0ABD2P7F3_9CUCU
MCFKNAEHENEDVGRLSENLGEWHKRFAHQNIERVEQILKRGNIEYYTEETEKLENEISHEDIASENEILYEEVKSVERNSEDDTSYGSVEEQENNRRLRKIPKWLADNETSFISIYHSQRTNLTRNNEI